MKTERKLSRVSRPELTRIIELSETASGRHNTGKRKWFKITHRRGHEYYTVAFYGYSAYVGLQSFERMLAARGIKTEHAASGSDLLALVRIPVMQ